MDSIIEWARKQPFVEPMKECMQDPIWHAEGDVWTHTEMVYEELPKIHGWEGFSDLDKKILGWVAIFHDSGKPKTTTFDPVEGRTRSRGHARVGEKIAWEYLQNSEPWMRLHVCRLIRVHGMPPWFLDAKNPDHEVVKTSWLAQNDLLYHFCKADFQGRISTEPISNDTLEMWRMTAEELGCFGGAFSFKNSRARYQLFQGKLDYLQAEPYIDKSKSHVTLMMGIPGSGKDTFIQENNTKGEPVVSLDDLRRSMNISPTGEQGRVIQAAKEECRIHLRKGQNFFFNATNVVQSTREKWIRLFMDYGAEVSIVWCMDNLSVCLKRNAKRTEPVPEDVIRKLYLKTDIPSYKEAHNVVPW